MSIGEQLHIYKGILGNKNNPLDVRFKLVKTFKKHGQSMSLYQGFRIDNMALAAIEDGTVIDLCEITYTSEDISIKPSIFISIVDGSYFCDVLDDYRVCTLIHEDDYSAHHGCCNVEKIGPREFVKFKSNRSFK